MKNEWLKLYNKAKDNLKRNEIEPFIVTGNNSCSILSENGNVYTGVNINSKSKLCRCAEMSAIGNMISQGESKVKKIVILNELEEPIMPCRDCIIYLLEFDNNTEILVDIDDLKTIKLKELIPDWYGTLRIEK